MSNHEISAGISERQTYLGHVIPHGVITFTADCNIPATPEPLTRQPFPAMTPGSVKKPPPKIAATRISAKRIAVDDEDEEIVPRPFVKWVGGKRQLLPVLHAAAPKEFNVYHEPFVGGGALLFSHLPGIARISDANAELINCYQVVRDDVEALLRSLATHINEEEHFYTVRAKDVQSMTPVQRASRFIYLNKTCFNGLYRENKKGQFNSPFGRYTNPKIADRKNLTAISQYLLSADVNISCEDYRAVLDNAKAGDFVYFDPPYVPLTKTANFSGYLKGGFGPKHQAELAALFNELTSKGVFAMLSNSNTDLVHELYKGNKIQIVHASRAINSNGSKRGKEANEVLVVNY